MIVLPGQRIGAYKHFFFLLFYASVGREYTVYIFKAYLLFIGYCAAYFINTVKYLFVDRFGAGGKINAAFSFLCLITGNKGVKLFYKLPRFRRTYKACGTHRVRKQIDLRLFKLA